MTIRGTIELTNEQVCEEVRRALQYPYGVLDENHDAYIKAVSLNPDGRFVADFVIGTTEAVLAYAKECEAEE